MEFQSEKINSNFKKKKAVKFKNFWGGELSFFQKKEGRYKKKAILFFFFPIPD